MKTNRFLSAILAFLCVAFGLQAQTFHKNIEWKGVQAWTTDKTQGLVLVYEGASYASTNSLGYYVATIDVPADFSLDNHSVSVENARLSRLSSEETQAVIPFSETVSNSLAPETELISKGSYKQLKVKFLPLLKLKKDGSYRKVTEFDVVVRKQADGLRPARAAGELKLLPESLPCSILEEEYWVQFWVNDATLGADYQYTVIDGQLPDGLILIEEDGVIEIQSDENGNYMPVSSNGEFTIQASNGTTVLTREYEIITDCTNASIIRPANLTASCGVYSAQLTMSDPAMEVVFSPVGSLPDGLTITPDGLLSGTVSLPQTQVIIQASKSDGCAYETWLTIVDNSFSLNSFLRRGVLSVPYEDWLTASGGTAPYSYSATGLPQGLSVAANGKISGTPAESGQFAVTIATTDALSCTRNTSYTLTIAENSVLATGNWYKIRIPETGNSTGTTITYTPEKRIYKLTYEDLAQMEGINPSQDIHVFGYGGAMLNENISTLTNEDLPELPVYIEKGEDGIFNAGDYILFYTQGPVSWSYETFTDSGQKEFVRTRNPYSNYGYYFVASGLGTPTLEPAQAEEFDDNTRPTGTIDRGLIHILHENETVNLANSGRNWYGESFTSSTLNRDFQVTIPDYVSGDIFVRSKAVAKSPVNSTSLRLYAINGNSTKINYGGTDATFPITGTAGTDAYATAKFASKDIAGKFNNGNNQTFTLRFNYNNQGNASATAWLDYFTITAFAKLKMVDAQLPFRYNTFDAKGSYYPHFEIDNVTEPKTVVWDVTNPNKALRIPTTVTNTKLGFTTRLDKQKEFIAFNPQGTFPKPESVGKVENQNLQTLKNIDLVILSPQDFLTDAERLATAHRTADNLNVLVVTPEQVYNEFSSGTPDATAYRLLMRNVHSSSPADRSNYLLLFGDGQFDNRVQTNQKNLFNYLLTYQAENSIHLTDSYLCDDYFGFVRAGETIGEGKIDIGIGRLPVSTTAQAKDVVDKIIRYMGNPNTDKGYWKNQLIFLSDDGDNHLHVKGSDIVAKQTANLFPKFQLEKIYIDAYKQTSSGSTESYPQATERFRNLLKNGVLLFNYTGHGGTSGITNEGLLDKTYVLATPIKNLAFWLTATCDFAVFDNPSISGGSIGEASILKPDGGAIGLYTTTRTVFSDRNDYMNQRFMSHAFQKDAQGNRLRLGDVMKLAKQDIADSSALMILNGLSYTLLADPALTLNYPEYNVVTDQIKGQAADSGVTIGALDRVEITGHIADEGGQTLTDFNGFVELNLYDKKMTKKTLNNHGELESFEFTDRDKITTAKAAVTDGQFAITILMPKSLSPEIGTGRLNYYAASETAEAYGIFENFNIGGEGEPDPGDDDEGPAMSIYLNTPSFVSGSQVNETPTFFAELSDPNGINYSGSSSIFNIGHDLKITLDNSTEYIVNSYFTADLGSYTSGAVQYTFPPLPAGKHHLEFKAWDMLNNSNSASLDFEVVTGLSMFQAKAYPNPAKTTTTFHLEYNQPQNAQSYTLKVYDLTGRLVWTETQPASATANLTEIAWGLNASGGQRLQTGIYLYNAEVLNKDGKTSVSKTQKLIIQ